MRLSLIITFVLALLLGGMASLYALEAPETASNAFSWDLGSIIAWVWLKANTAAGIAFILAAWSWVMAFLFTKKPKWKKYYDGNKGWMVEAVKMAEKQIPDDTDNKNARRADAALQYLLKLMGGNAPKDTEHLKQALNVVHGEVSKNK